MKVQAEQCALCKNMREKVERGGGGGNRQQMVKADQNLCLLGAIW